MTWVRDTQGPGEVEERQGGGRGNVSISSVIHLPKVSPIPYPESRLTAKDFLS